MIEFFEKFCEEVRAHVRQAVRKLKLELNKWSDIGEVTDDTIVIEVNDDQNGQNNQNQKEQGNESPVKYFIYLDVYLTNKQVPPYKTMRKIYSVLTSYIRKYQENVNQDCSFQEQLLTTFCTMLQEALIYLSPKETYRIMLQMFPDSWFLVKYKRISKKLQTWTKYNFEEVYDMLYDVTKTVKDIENLLKQFDIQLPQDILQLFDNRELFAEEVLLYLRKYFIEKLNFNKYDENVFEIYKLVRAHIIKFFLETSYGTDTRSGPKLFNV